MPADRTIPSVWRTGFISRSALYAMLLAIAVGMQGACLLRHRSNVSSNLKVWTNPKDGLEYVWIPAGTFHMGCVLSDPNCSGDEKPRHKVTISKGYWMSRTEVTVGAWKKYADATGKYMPKVYWKNPVSGIDYVEQWKDHPVVHVTWEEVVDYCRWAGVRLPTEAEWEYAARGGFEGRKYPWGDMISHDYANYGQDECCKGLAVGKDQWVNTSPVASFEPNGFGLYDMAGNVYEWCQDWYQSDYYRESSALDPQGPTEGFDKVLRGGDYQSGPDNMVISRRIMHGPDDWADMFGFRCVRN